ncbi:MAG: molybdopterin-binding protein [Maricaulis sp.]|uniref:competence/damage-inducible protein A n=1 Tax=Maricaulis sp. TaxID=1486257 RepID=UPI001B0D1D74|nr:molybdopterin-binding protein [Maricaulis sp.]MBO6729394.1 competence/damage-inducible protein A [Maricaulis sp.]MBO6847054.1 competence/damage-inducible protein A [Maricaulis sp.]MBO6877285.1 competence/damage-inducible protein A [Maricaulis sp.]MDM7984010.1 molybdopterin-binding protein [Maricaulis sp.]
MKQVTAAVLLIGDEVLSGRTQDKNLQQIAQFLAPLGINISECRVVPDVEEEIVDAVNTLRAKADYVFTTGGIGPTHDDITADSIARAFGVGIDVRADALAIIEHWYEKTGTPLTESRKRMARIPDTASLIENPVTGAPGFQTGNVFTLAGVPKIARGMLEDIAHRLEGGAVTRSRSVKGEGLREGDIAVQLGELQSEYPDVSIGSYPYFLELQDGKLRRGTQLVVRATDETRLDAVIDRIIALVKGLGHEPELA